LGYKVIGIDLSAGALEEATVCGADYVFNPVNDKDYIAKVKEITKGGVHAAVNFTASKRAYDTTPPLIRLNGILMCVGIPNEPLTYMAMDIAMNKYRIGGSNNGVPQMLGPCLDFSAKHGIAPHCSYYKIEQINEMIDLMHEGKARGRLAVKWD
jgi:propanol-preferring alcohol dehydrogenase